MLGVVGYADWIHPSQQEGVTAMQATNAAAPAVTTRRVDPTAACALCASRLVGLCAPLDAGLLGEVAQETARITLAPGTTIFLQGDAARHVISLVRGSARLVRVLPDGRRCAIGFRFAGELLGYTPERDYPFSAETLTDATICRIDRRRLVDLFRLHPVIEGRMLDLCARELSATQDHLLVLGRFSAEERVAAFLFSLVAAQQARGRSATQLDLPATRADLGDLLGLTLETVSRVLSAFRRRGLIVLHGATRIELLKPQAVAQLARGEGPRAGN